MTLYVRSAEFPGVTPTWHRLVAHADSSRWVYWRCFSAAAAFIDATAKVVPDGRICSKCEHIEERDLTVDDGVRRVVVVKQGTYREVGTGLLLDLDAGHIWRTRPPKTWASL